jgi:phosphoglycolate phosphatase-like HAD superfamily hydrolase
MLGPAPIVDFDGTLTSLPVAWDELRTQLGVSRVGELWKPHNTGAWALVREFELDAARRAAPFEPVRAGLEASTVFAVLTANSEDAVKRFVERFADLASRVAIVVGRETLAGPKHDYDVFRRGFAQCVAATESARSNGRVVYAGDADWELDFARKLGAEAIDARTLIDGP